MKKFFIIMSIIILIILAVVTYKYNSYRTNELRTQKLNHEYEVFTEGEILGTSLITIINKAVDSNEKNGINTDNNNMYIENDTTSIKIEVKFLEAENTFPMERIQKLGSEEFIKNYAVMNFKCTKKEYHKKTNNIKYMLFEQI